MTVTGIFTALIVGLVIGALGRLAVPGKQNIPVWLTMLIGVVAALLGTALARVMGVDTEGFSLIELLVQIALAAAGVFAVVGLMSRGDHGQRHSIT
ncbi:MAG TPA: GlsB/YeaQ/YmgE family stress response membrane protein [Pilimelia sp.]|nr:GlsB/YeaQ/YmgE family stress response membrane protein [Pilimelia sp.]